MTQPTVDLDSLLQLAGRGWRLFPTHGAIAGPGRLVCTCLRQCDAPAKHPRVKEWQLVATVEAAQIEKWWRKWPDANWAVATGRAAGAVGAGLIVVDVDSPAQAGVLAGLAKAHGRFPE